MEKVNKMYDAVQELVCAFVVNKEAVEKAKRQKKGMLKAYQERDTDLENAFQDCLEICKEIKNSEESGSPSLKGLKEFLLDVAKYYGSEVSLHDQEIHILEQKKELPDAGVVAKRRFDNCIAEHRKSIKFYSGKMGEAMTWANKL